eukprot:363545-Chlamydomonas_euryale.AAC.9
MRNGCLAAVRRQAEAHACVACVRPPLLRRVHRPLHAARNCRTVRHDWSTHTHARAQESRPGPGTCIHLHARSR